MQNAQSFHELQQQIKIRFIPFFVAFFVVVFVTFLILYIIDFYPEPVSDEVSETNAVAITGTETEALAVAATSSAVTAMVDVPNEPQPVVAGGSAYPVSISFPALDRTVPVLNPVSNDIATLDQALLEGVVRHPDSADLVNTGNVFILGHSSYLPNVFNKNFQAFNGIQDLKWGDTISVTSTDTEYIYRVDRVYESPASEIIVPVDGTQAKLTLATCDSFGSRDDRFIVEATLIDTAAL